MDMYIIKCVGYARYMIETTKNLIERKKKEV